jgi:hypothetical protein
MAERVKGPKRVVGFAIVSEDGMLADAQHVMPESLKFDADQKYFADGMDTVEVSIHGKHSHEQQLHSARRHRITVTHDVPGVAPDPKEPKGVLWNPAGASFEEAWAAFKLNGASLGVVGATSVFGLFLDSYEEFHLTRAPKVTLPGGVPVFPGVPTQTPEEIMRAHGLEQGETKTLDAAKGVTVTIWRRKNRN